MHHLLMNFHSYTHQLCFYKYRFLSHTVMTFIFCAAYREDQPLRIATPAKYCKWGTCTSNSKKDKSIVFFPFPKPCEDFRALKADPSLIAIQHDPDSCSQCAKCAAWIRACSIQNFSRLEQINGNCYVCYKHFPDDKPTQENPCPVSARSFSQVSSFMF